MAKLVAHVRGNLGGQLAAKINLSRSCLNVFNLWFNNGPKSKELLPSERRAYCPRDPLNWSKSIV